MNSNGTNTGDGSPEGACALCGSLRIVPLYEARDVPVFCNNLWAGREEAVACPRGDIELLFCHTCGYIWNAIRT